MDHEKKRVLMMKFGIFFLILLIIPMTSIAFAHPTGCSGGVGFGCNVPDWYPDMLEMKIITLLTLVSLLGGICYCVLKSVIQHRLSIAGEKNTFPIQ